MKLFQILASTTLVTSIAFTSCTSSSTETKPSTDTTATATTTEAGNMSGDNQQKLEANKKLVTDFCQSLYGDKDSTAIDKYIADNIIEHNPLLPKDGKEFLKNELRPFLSMPGLKKTKVDIEMMAAEGDKVWLLLKDTAPNGKVFARVNIFRIENDKIAEAWKVAEFVPKEDVNHVF